MFLHPVGHLPGHKYVRKYIAVPRYGEPNAVPISPGIFHMSRSGSLFLSMII